MGADEPQTQLLARGGRNGEVMLAGRRRKGRARRWVTRLVLLVVVVAMLPFVLTLVYRLPGVMPVSTLMLADTMLGDGYERDWTRLENISPNLVHAVMMSEDGRFCSHEGIDWPALHGEIEDALSGEKVRGASTITMQTVKNLFLWPGRSFVRKGIEVPLALYFDAVIAKPRIMEIYLNIAEWAPGIYGAEAAARHHFGRSAASLSPRQAALLAVTLPNPHARDPAQPSGSLAELAGLIERRAAQAGAYVGCLK